jgi:hypothetical protein
MQVHLLKQMPSVRDGYLDLRCIAQTNFIYAKDWALDGKELAAGKTIEKKEAIRRMEIREASLKVAAYISVALKYLQHNSTIWLPYNFE